MLLEHKPNILKEKKTVRKPKQFRASPEKWGKNKGEYSCFYFHFFTRSHDTPKLLINLGEIINLIYFIAAHLLQTEQNTVFKLFRR